MDAGAGQGPLMYNSDCSIFVIKIVVLHLLLFLTSFCFNCDFVAKNTKITIPLEPTNTNIIAVLFVAFLTHTRESPDSILTHSVICVRTVVQVVRSTLVYVFVTGTASPACLATARAIHVVT